MLAKLTMPWEHLLYFFAFLIFLQTPPTATATAGSGYYSVFTSFLYFASKENTVDGSARLDDTNISLGTGYISSQGLYFGYKAIRNLKKINQDSQLALAHGPSVGLVYPDYYFSIILTYFIDFSYKYVNLFLEEQTDGSTNRSKITTTYFGNNAWMLDFNIIPEGEMLRIGPGFSFINFHYNKLKHESRFLSNSNGPSSQDGQISTQELGLESGKWDDSWIFPYLGIRLLF